MKITYTALFRGVKEGRSVLEKATVENFFKLSIVVRTFCTPAQGESLQRGLACALFLGPLLLSAGVQAQKPQSAAKRSPTLSRTKAIVENGRILFQKNCSPCHGAGGQGGEGPNLQKMLLTDATISTTIKQGVQGEMPAFGGKFKEADIKALTAFVHSIQTSRKNKS